ncbi:MAG TPA: hypothetical protein VKQ08_00125, partial [Cyclobacteriaceae bacterium]|nr:hypothetical protein [Cyclobacteriaceae bacterium]
MRKYNSAFKKFTLGLVSALFSMVLAHTASGQSISADTLQWNATGFTDLNHNTVVSNAPCQFISYGNQKVDWV